MFVLDYVPDDILFMWLDHLREATITQDIQWKITDGQISAKLDDLHTFLIIRHEPDAYWITINVPHHNGRTALSTLTHKERVREDIFAYTHKFYTDIVTYASMTADLKPSLKEFHRLITSR